MRKKYTVFFLALMAMLLLTACQDGQFTLPEAADFAEPTPASEAEPVDAEPVATESEPVVGEHVESEPGEAAESKETLEQAQERDTEAESVDMEVEPEAAGSAEGLVFSEVLIAAPGDNNREFIELYNASETAIDLNGYSLSYLLDAGQEEQLVYSWTGRAEVPPLGHYFLAREGQDFGLTPDAIFDTPLSQRKGGLVLRAADGQSVTQFGWGDAPQGFVAGTAVDAISDGSSMERLPAGEAGNGVDSGNNAADFVANREPNPQNSGSPATPLAADHLLVSLSAPEVVEPGTEFDLLITVENQGTQDAQNITVAMPTVPEFTLVNAPPGAEQTDGLLSWSIPTLEAGASTVTAVTLQSPFTYIDALFSGVYAAADAFSRDYSEPQLTAMAGGAIPIATARDLMGSTVSVEGVATMYTGGFFAGSGTKFYIEDETGGIQVYVPGAGGVLNVDIGDRVRVSGDIELYRDSIELVPGDFNVDVEVVEQGAGAVQPALISTVDNENNPEVLGRLNTIEGTVTRIDEFTYSYEIDLVDEEGNQTLAYIEKDTSVTAELVELGERYRVTGISEFYSGDKQIKPRLQSDIVKIFPPILLLEVGADNNARPGEIVTYVISATNHTAEPLTNVVITTPIPDSGASLAEISAGGEPDGGQIVWNIEEIAPQGGLSAVSFNVDVNDSSVQSIELGSVTAVADQWPDPASTEPYLTFIGSGVPIWAIQGPGERSPYALSKATTSGVVTGAFPELGGFWIQELESDDDPATSAGLFVLYDAEEIAELPVQEGNLVQVSGLVREISGQTTLHVAGVEDITVLAEEQSLPEATAFDPPRENEAADVYKESLEGMLVTLPGTAVAVAPTTQYGEFVLVNDHWGIDTVRRGEETGFFIMVDDGSQVAHDDQSTLPYTVQKGDRLENLAGPLAYTFEQYKIELLTAPLVFSAERDLPTLQPAAENQFSVATFNVENLFDTRDPHPSSPPRPSREAYENKLQKIAAAIEAMGAPAIIGLQEVENIGILEDLAAVELIAPYDYEGYLIEGLDDRGIDVAYLVRGDRVTVEEVEAFPEPTGLTSRPPLLIKATIDLASGPQTVYLFNNHLSSLSSGEAATEPRRTGQAAWNVTLMEQVLAEDPEAQFIVMGDLNSFLGTPPLDVLQDAGLRHAYEFFANEEDIPYTYIFQGATQTLDHILMSENLFAQVSDVSTLAIDADYPLAAADDPSAQRVSDHDPLVVMFTID